MRGGQIDNKNHEFIEAMNDRENKPPAFGKFKSKHGDRYRTNATSVTVDMRGLENDPMAITMLRDAVLAMIEKISTGPTKKVSFKNCITSVYRNYNKTLTAHLPNAAAVIQLTQETFKCVNDNQNTPKYKLLVDETYHGMDGKGEGISSPYIWDQGGGGGRQHKSVDFGRLTKADVKRMLTRQAGIMEDLKALALSKGIHSYTTKANLVDGVARKAKLAELQRFAKKHVK